MHAQLAKEWICGGPQRLALLGRSITGRTRGWIIALILGLTAIAGVLFPSAYASEPDMGADLFLIPVVLTAAAFGLAWGMVALVTAVAVVALLILRLGDQPQEVITVPAFASASLVVTIAGLLRLALGRMSRSESELAATVANASDGIVSIDEQGQIRVFNSAAERLFGYTAAESIGQSLDRLIPIESVTAHRDHVRRYGAGDADGPRPMGGDVWGVRKSGERVPLECTIGRTTKDGQIVMTVVIRDVSERKRAEAEIERRTFYDHLTGLANRSRLEEDLERELASAADGAPLALVTLNINDFHEINDTFGYSFGDRMLCELAHRLSVLGPDVVAAARVAGDDFSVAARVADGAAARRFSDRAVGAVEEPFELDGLRLTLGCSLGLALAPRDGSDAAALLRSSDIALSHAKAARRTVAEFSPALLKSTPERLALLTDLREAIDKGEMRVVFQPQVSLRTGALTGVEALARWWHRDRGAIPPSEFIVLAERSGLIGRLTAWVLDASLRAAAGLLAAHGPVRMSVNVSMRNVNAELPDLLSGMLAKHGVDARWLTIELTESALAANVDAVVTVLEGLRALGVGISIDDFGTGYSSLALLSRLPVQELKIDGSFVRGLLREPRAAAVVRATLALAKEIGVETVAEAVEDAATWTMLREMGCTTSQGFFTGPPMDEGDLVEWARTREVLPTQEAWLPVRD